MTMEPRKATHEQLKRHNRQMLLRAVYLGLADSRAALAHMTGLTKPTVSSLVAELIAEGLVSEGGHGPASESGGKRPRLIEFRADARQIIGVSVDHVQVTGVLTDLAGQVVAHHRVELDAKRPLELIVGVIDGLRAQLDAPLLCIGVGLPGEVDTRSGGVRRSVPLGWRDLQVAAPLAGRYRVPVHLAHATELSALAQYAFGEASDQSPQRLVTLLLDRGVEIGVTLERGAFHYGGDLSGLRLPHFPLVPPTRTGAPVDPDRVARGRPESGEIGELLGGSGRLAGAVRELLDTSPSDEVDYLALRYAAANGDRRAAELIDQIASRVAPLLAWAVALLRPDHLSLAGPMTDLGGAFLDRLQPAASEWLPAADLETVTITLAHSRLSGALGAVALALQKELSIV
ncbi:MAG: ROK family transcriptional regulator [Trueperaceae bacterium]